MNVFVLLYKSSDSSEGIHSIEIKGRTIVLMFEDIDDAERYCGLLEAQDFPVPVVEQIDRQEIETFCNQANYEAKFVNSNFVPQSPEERLLISPPQKNLDVSTWDQNSSDELNIDEEIEKMRNNLEKLL